jgi:hypothetical protein
VAFAARAFGAALGMVADGPPQQRAAQDVAGHRQAVDPGRRSTAAAGFFFKRRILTYKLGRGVAAAPAAVGKNRSILQLPRPAATQHSPSALGFLRRKVSYI